MFTLEKRLMGDLVIFFNYLKAMFFQKVCSWRRQWSKVATREIWSGHKEKIFTMRVARHWMTLSKGAVEICLCSSERCLFPQTHEKFRDFSIIPYLMSES